MGVIIGHNQVGTAVVIEVTYRYSRRGCAHPKASGAAEATITIAQQHRNFAGAAYSIRNGHIRVAVTVEVAYRNLIRVCTRREVGGATEPPIAISQQHR